MKKEPCIRLGMRIRPKIREKPEDKRNRSPPRARLLIARMAACAEVICVIIGKRVSRPTRRRPVKIEGTAEPQLRPAPSPRRGEGWGEGVTIERLAPPHPRPLPDGE